MTDYELYHHGVKGQKWGVRRTAAQLGHRVAGTASKTAKALYKNAKSAGKAIGKEASKAGKAAKKAAVTKVKKTVAETKEKNYYKKLHKKKLSQMTDKEIKDLTDRVKKEASLKDAKYEMRAQNARKFYKNVAQQPVNSFASTFGVELAKNMFKDKSDVSGNDNKEKSSNTVQNLKQKAADKYHSFDIETVVTTEPAPQRKKKTAEKGTANTFNNPVTIRHGR